MEEKREKNQDYLIKKYEKIRKVLRLMYLYGCYSRDEISVLNQISPRSYDNELKRIKFAIGEEHMKSTKNKKKQNNTFINNMIQNKENYLVNSYYLSSITKNDIELHFLLQQIIQELQVNDIKCTLEEILQELQDSINGDIEYSESTVKRSLKELVEKEIVVSEKDKKSKLYKLNTDILEYLTQQELEDLYYAVDFYSNIAIISTPYYNIKHKIKKQLYYKYSIETKDVYIFRHNTFVNTVDEEILNQIIQAIQDKKIIKYRFKEEKQNIKNQSKEEIRIISPLAIISEYYYSRQYLLGVDEENSTYTIDRIDYITDIKETSKKIQIKANIDILDNIWTTSFPKEERSIIQEKNLKKVELNIKVNKDEQYVIDRFKKEMRKGILTKIDNETYSYQIEVLDPYEMIPFLRTYIPNIVVLHSEEHCLKEKLEKDIKETLSNYGII